MNREFVKRARRRLQKEHDRLERLQDHMHDGQLDVTLGESIQELSTYDNHPADIGSDVFERSKDMALSGLLVRRMAEIEDALDAIDGGTYGLCENCGAEIPQARLEAAPETTLCVECKADVELGRYGVSDRPVEEDVLKPPFARTFNDNDPRNPVGFDGEDSWQKVARYGTSNTPSDVPGARTVEDAFINSDENHGTVEDVEAVFVDEDEADDGQFIGEIEERSPTNAQKKRGRGTSRGQSAPG